MRDLRPTVVLSPALGGVVIGQEVARALGVRAIFVERQDGELTLRRGFVIADNDRVVAVFPGWEDFETFVVTRDGQGIRFAEADVRPVSRSAGGIRAIRLRGDYLKLATCGLVCAGSQLGIALGIIVLNLWHN